MTKGSVCVFYCQFCRSVCGLDARATLLLIHWLHWLKEKVECNFQGFLVMNRFHHKTKPEERTDHASQCVFVLAEASEHLSPEAMTYHNLSLVWVWVLAIRPWPLSRPG